MKLRFLLWRFCLAALLLSWAPSASAASADFAWPKGVVFLSGHVAESFDPDAQRFHFRIGNSRSYFELDTIGPSMLGHELHSLIPARPDGKLKLLHNAGSGLIGSPSVSRDGKTIFFSLVPAGESFFHIYKIAAEGGELQALTSGPFNDFDPAELPDGRIVFSSTRMGSREEYHGNIGRTLFVMNSEGRDLEPITHHIVGDNEPKVTANGQIAFIRQDNFMERAKVETHIHCIRPDGTAGHVLLGPDRQALGYDRANAAETDGQWLRSFGFGSPAPLPDGRIAALSSYGLVISGNEIMPPQRLHPPTELMDISALPDGRLLCTATNPNCLAIFNPANGEFRKLFDQLPNLHSVVYLGELGHSQIPRSAVSPAVNHTAGTTGFLLAQNVFYSRQTNAEMSRVKAIRIFEGVPFTTRSARHQYDHIGVDAVELGTVPLAPDGSFYVEVPADRALALQAIDGEGRSVVNQVSWIYVRPGEQRSCIGCHSERQAAPPNSESMLALRAGPVRLLGEGKPHRFRGNNAANGGMLNLQYDRFREVASIDLHSEQITPNACEAQMPGREVEEVGALIQDLSATSPSQKISAAQRLAIFRDRTAASALTMILPDKDASVRLNAALALSSCGTRESIAPLLVALDDPEPIVAQAAYNALNHLTGHHANFNSFAPEPERRESAAELRKWFAQHDAGQIEDALLTHLAKGNQTEEPDIIAALGHIGSERTKSALRDYISNDHGGNLRASMEALRALGHLRDTNAVELLSRVLRDNIKRVPAEEKVGKSHEFGWTQRPTQLAGAAAEALGRIGTGDAETALFKAYGELVEFWYYTFQTADHAWLMGCHSSIPHFRIAEALDRIGSQNAGPLVPALLRSIPIDTDRALLFENDGYEIVVSRVIHRSGRAEEVVQTCLKLLGEDKAVVSESLKQCVMDSPPALSVGPLDALSRAAQILSVVCTSQKDAPAIAAAFERFRSQPPSRTRSWVCFFLARTLGKLHDGRTVNSLLTALNNDATEASFGISKPPTVFLNDCMTPCYRAAAADALGRIGDKTAVNALLKAISNFDNALDVRNAAAHALARLNDAGSLPKLKELARDYPEMATRRVLLAACDSISRQDAAGKPVARANGN